MKYSFKIKLILSCLLLLSYFSGCGIDELGPRDCYTNSIELYREWNEDYNDDMTNIVDSEGNGQSLEACLMRRERTINYQSMLIEYELLILQNAQNEGCSQEEINKLGEEIGNRIDDLREDIEVIWENCEEVYGSGG